MTHPRLVSHPRRVLRWAILLTAGVFVPACGPPPKSLAELEPNELLELLHEEKLEVALDDLVEVDLGKFRITHPATENERPLLVSFQLAGVVYVSKKELLAAKKTEYEQRFRDAVIALIQRAERDQLADPRLNHLRAEIATLVNGQLRARAVRDVIFSDFSVEPS